MVQLGCQRPITTELIHPAFAPLEYGSRDYCTEEYGSVLHITAVKLINLKYYLRLSSRDLSQMAGRFFFLQI
jgi:hypothetical protein